MKFLMTITLMMCSLWGASQSLSQALRTSGITDKDILHQLRLCHDQVAKKSYYNAVTTYLDILEQIGDNAYVLNGLGHAALLARDYRKAVEAFERLNNEFPKHDYSMAYFELGEAYKYIGAYKKAQIVFSKFKRQKAHSMSVKLAKKWARNATNYCQYAINSSYQDSSFTRVKILPEQVNSAYTDFSPIAISHNEVMFASLRKEDVQIYSYGDKHPHNINLYKTTMDEEFEWDEPSLQYTLADEFDHIANGVYGPNDRFYYTKCYQNRENDNLCSIYFREVDEEGYFSKKEVRLPAKINKSGATTTQPTFGKVHKTKGRKTTTYDVMYFSTDRPGGVGGKDLWYVVLHNGRFGTPINCGKTINTVRDEVTPFYDQTEGKLYFSSNYHYGLGGFDVFAAKGKLKRFQKPHNLGTPVNTSYDDYYYTKPQDTSSQFGYIVSNRPGGFALTSETCCDDIYRFESFTPSMLPLDVIVLDDETRAPLLDAEVYVMSDYVKQKVVDQSSYLEFAKFKGVTDQHGLKQVERYDHVEYHVFVEKPGYELRSKTIDGDFDKVVFVLTRKEEASSLSISDTSRIEEKRAKFVSMPEKTLTSKTKASDVEKDDRLLLARLHFDYNDDAIYGESKDALKVLKGFLDDNAHIKVEIAGHTDNTGNEEYNFDLANRRAKAVVEYLVELGVKSKRLKAHGYGESQPLAPNRMRDGRDNPEGRRLNRRTEIVILHK